MAEMSPRNGVEEGAWQGAQMGQRTEQIRAQNEVGALRKMSNYGIRIHIFL